MKLKDVQQIAQAMETVGFKAETIETHKNEKVNHIRKIKNQRFYGLISCPTKLKYFQCACVVVKVRRRCVNVGPSAAVCRSKINF